MKKATVTLVDVAKLAGVSVMTASRALSPDGSASQKARTKVEAAAQQLGYIPNALARMMKGARTNVIGVVVNDISSAILAQFVTALSLEVRKYEMDLFIYNSLGDMGKGKGQRLSQLLHGLWDGLVFVMPRMTDDYLRTLEATDSPIVLISYARDTTLPVVRADNQSGACDAVTHLIDLGHRRIAFISGFSYTGQSEEREAGYRMALEAAGLPYDPELVLTGDFSEQAGIDAARTLLALPQPPTAIFAGNDSMAIGCMRTAQAAGLRVPQDLSVVGFDDIPESATTTPPLTTLRHPIEAMARAAVQDLMRRIQGEPGRRHQIQFPSEFVVRGSTGPLAGAAAPAAKRGRPRKSA